MLEVGVKGDDDLSASGVEARLQCRGLPVIAGQVDHAQPRLALDVRLHYRERFIAAAVVDQQDLEAVPVLERLERATGALDERPDQRRLVIDRRDHADERHVHPRHRAAAITTSPSDR